MRRDGDLLIRHLAAARERVLLCAPFIKAPVLRRLLDVIAPSVSVSIVTRWHADEVAAGVSDLEVLDIAMAREGATLALLNHLHAKIYLADTATLVGSANLTATALGWCQNPNLETLVLASGSDRNLAACITEIEEARPATEEERQRIHIEAAATPKLARLPDAADMDEDRATIWLPRLGDPGRLYQIYAGQGLERMIRSTVDAGSRDVEALGLPTGLDEAAFMRVVGRAFSGMPAIASLLTAVDRDLLDEDAVDIIDKLPLSNGMPPDKQWLVVREWISRFLADRIEIAPQSFVTRRRPGAKQ